MASPSCLGIRPNVPEFLRTFFSSGYKPELQNECCRNGVNLTATCLISFYPGNNSVQAYGGVERGAFKADPDIAGFGVFLSLIPALLVAGLASVYLILEALDSLRRCRANRKPQPRKPSPRPSNNRLKRYYRQRFQPFASFVSESLLFVVGDAQLVTAFAYGINFGNSGKCTVSAYHYSVMVNTLVIALSSLTLSVYLPRHYWRARFPATMRTLATIVVFAFLLRFLAYQVEQESSPELMMRGRASSSDSSLFLPVACFLDPNLDPFKTLSATRIETIGGRGEKWTPELILAYVVALCYLAAHLTRLGCHLQKRPRPLFVTFFVIFICAFAIGLCFGHIAVLRRWVDRSGWMEKRNGPGPDAGNPENSLVGIGQLLPITTVAWILILSFEIGKRTRSVPDRLPAKAMASSSGDLELGKRQQWVTVGYR